MGLSVCNGSEAVHANDVSVEVHDHVAFIAVFVGVLTTNLLCAMTSVLEHDERMTKCFGDLHVTFLDDKMLLLGTYCSMTPGCSSYKNLFSYNNEPEGNECIYRIHF